MVEVIILVTEEMLLRALSNGGITFDRGPSTKC